MDDLSEEAAKISIDPQGSLLAPPILKYATCLSERSMEPKYFDVLQPTFGGLRGQTCPIISPCFSQNGFPARASENISCN